MQREISEAKAKVVMSRWFYGFVVFDSSMNMDKSDGELLSVFDADCDFLLSWLLQIWKFCKDVYQMIEYDNCTSLVLW